jgi:tetratricopeptide (TPR) repeat protein
LIVADFENRTADSTLGGSVTEAFRIDLAQSPVVTVMPSSAVGQALERMKRDPLVLVEAATAREVALREGAKAIVSGEISPVGKGFVLSAKLLAPADGAELVAIRETAENDGMILQAIDRLSRRMRERIGESLRTIRSNEPLEQVTTSSLEALRLYSQGARAVDRDDNEDAIKLLGQAIAVDTGFAMAYRKLAVALDNSGADATRIVEAATKAYEHRERLPEVERYQTTAYYFWDVDWNPEKIEAAYRSVLAINPDDGTALNNLSLLLSTQRRWAEAEQLAARATEGTDLATSFFVNLLQAQLAQGKRSEARTTLDRFAKGFPESPRPLLARANFASSMGAYDSARNYLLAVARTHPDLSQREEVSSHFLAVSLVQGKLAEAERNGDELLGLAEKRGLPADYLVMGTSLGLVQVVYRNDPAAGLKAVEAALKRHPLASLAPINRPYSALASFYAKAGQPVRARQLLAEYQSTVPASYRRRDNNRYRAAGDIGMAEGKAEEALTNYRAWRDSAGCTNCALYELGRAYELVKLPDSALAAYQQAVSNPGGLGRVYGDAWTLAATYRRLGELFEDRGDREKAIDSYGKFIDLWKQADPELQPQVKEAKERLARLVGEKP